MTDDKINVLIATDFSDEIVARLRDVSPRLHIEQHFPDVPDKVWKRTEIVCTSSTIPTPLQAPNLKWIQLLSAGMEHVKDMPIITQNDVTVTSTSGIHATHMGEYTIGMMLAWEFKLPTMVKDKKNKIWREDSYNFYAPRHLRGQTIGIVGYGSIGREIARLANALGMIVLASKRDAMQPADKGGYREPGTGDPEGDIPERIYPSEAVASMAKECDYLVILAPVTPATRHMINASVLEAMRDHAVLINIARGSIIDEAALVEALRENEIGGAILDVFEEEPLPKDSPLWDMSNVIISPHVSGNSIRYHEKAAAVFAENLQRYLKREDMLNQLNTERGY